jgi:hypothetical protein
MAQRYAGEGHFWREVGESGLEAAGRSMMRERLMVWGYFSSYFFRVFRR